MPLKGPQSGKAAVESVTTMLKSKHVGSTESPSHSHGPPSAPTYLPERPRASCITSLSSSIFIYKAMFPGVVEPKRKERGQHRAWYEGRDRWAPASLIFSPREQWAPDMQKPQTKSYAPVVQIR